LLLQRTLERVVSQLKDGSFSFEIVVIDNDCERSAEDIVKNLQATAAEKIVYDCEPEQNIALARNKAVQDSTGEIIAFIDDDEKPCEKWLSLLYSALKKYKVDGVLGPVKPDYHKETPQWVIKGDFYKRENHKTGVVLTWEQSRTGNLMLWKAVFDKPDNRFQREFGRGGEDRDFFRRLIKQGYRFVWCSEAEVWECVPKERCTRSFMLKRALVRGTHPHFSTIDYIKSLLAIPLYCLSSPFAFIFGQHIFMKVVIRLCDHLGRILALAGYDIVHERYVQK